MLLPKDNAVASKKLRQSARGQDCTLRIAGVCNYDPETVVLCHFPCEISASKSTDMSSGFGCSACHDVIDGRVPHEFEPGEKDTYMRRSQNRTHNVWIRMGLLSFA